LTVNAFGFGYRAAFRIVAAGLGLLAVATARQTWPGGWPWSVTPLVAAWIWGLARTPWSLDPAAAVGQALDRTALVVPLVVLAGSGITARGRRWILGAGLAGMTLVAVWGILQTLGIHPFIERALWEPSWPARPLGTHNLLGGYLVAWLPVAVAWFLAARGTGKLLLGVATLLAWASLLGTASRGAWLAALIVAALLVPWIATAGRRLLLELWRRTWRVHVAVALAMVLIGLLAARGIVERLETPGRVVTGRALPAGDDGVVVEEASIPAVDATDLSQPSGSPSAAASPIELSSIERRGLIAQGAWRLIRQRPLEGHGGGAFRLAFYAAKPPLMQRLEALTGQTAAHAHWDALELAVEHGLVGLVLVVGGVVWILWRGAGALRRPHDLVPVGVWAGAVGLLLHGLIDFDFHEVPTALVGAMFLGLLAAVPGPTTPAAPGQGMGRGLRIVAAAILVASIVVAALEAAAEVEHRRAYRALTGGDLDGATAYLERARRLVVDRATYAVALGEIDGHRDRLAHTLAARRQALESAAHHFAAAAQLEPTVARRALRVARSLEAAREVGVAVRTDSIVGWGETAIRRNPYLTGAHLLVASMQRAAGDFDGAAAALAAARDHAPGPGPRPELALEASRLAEARGDTAAAIEGLAGLAADSGHLPAVDALAALGRRVPAARAVLEALAAGRRPAAAPAAHGPAEPVPAGVSARARLGLADLELAAGAHETAARWLESLDGRVDAAELALRRGLVAYRRGDLETAAADYRTAVTGRPLDAVGYQGFGDVALASGDTARALRSYERALVRAPDNPELTAFVAALRRQDSISR
jgi:tetratricopeptide (TPR) repeat protein